MFLDRSRKAGPRLEWKVRAFVVAAVLGIAGIYFEERWMTLSAILVLVAGLALRLGPSEPSPEEAEERAPDEEEEREEEDE